MKTFRISTLTVFTTLLTLSSALYIPDNAKLAKDLSRSLAPGARGEELHRRQALPPVPQGVPPPPLPIPNGENDDGPASTTPQNVANTADPDAMWWYGWPEVDFQGQYEALGAYYPDICYPVKEGMLTDAMYSTRTYGPGIYVHLYLTPNCEGEYLDVDAAGWGDLSKAPAYRGYKMYGKGPPAPDAVIS